MCLMRRRSCQAVKVENIKICLTKNIGPHELTRTEEERKKRICGFFALAPLFVYVPKERVSVVSG